MLSSRQHHMRQLLRAVPKSSAWKTKCSPLRNCQWLSSSSSSSYNPNQQQPKQTVPPPIIPGSSNVNAYGSLGDAYPSHLYNAPATAWQAERNADVQRVTQNAMIYELTQQQAATIQNVVPWFLSNMPASYFRQVPESFRMDHIKAIASIRDANMDLYLNLKSHAHDGRVIYTFIRPGTQPGTLLSMVDELPYDEGLPLSRLHAFSALDDSMSLNMFVYGHKQFNEPKPIDSPAILEILALAKQVQAGLTDMEPNPIFEPDALMQYMQKCSDNYLNIISRNPIRFLQQRLLFEQVSGTEGSAVNIEQAAHEGSKHYWIDVAVANTIPQVALQHTCRLLYVQDFDVKRARLDVIDDGDNGSVTLLRLLVEKPDSIEDTFLPRLLSQEIKRSKWLDNTTMDLIFDKYTWLGVKRAEIITGMCSLMHTVFAKENPLVYSKGNILEMVTHKRTIGHAAKIADLFLERFHPDKEQRITDEVTLQARMNEIKQAIDSDVENTVTVQLLNKMLDIVKHTYKTNVYMQNRYALGFRLDPQIMEPHPEQGKVYEEVPYGILFVHGRRFNGYHVRFRDIARGGMRLVTPASVEQYALESARQYDEAYGLAFGK